MVPVDALSIAYRPPKRLSAESFFLSIVGRVFDRICCCTVKAGVAALAVVELANFSFIANAASIAGGT